MISISTVLRQNIYHSNSLKVNLRLSVINRVISVENQLAPIQLMELIVLIVRKVIPLKIVDPVVRFVTMPKIHMDMMNLSTN